MHFLTLTSTLVTLALVTSSTSALPNLLPRQQDTSHTNSTSTSSASPLPAGSICHQNSIYTALGGAHYREQCGCDYPGNDMFVHQPMVEGARLGDCIEMCNSYNSGAAQSGLQQCVGVILGYVETGAVCFLKSEMQGECVPNGVYYCEAAVLVR
jgi:hypothetical protein